MRLTKKKGISIILIALIILTLSTIYILKPGSEKFVIFDIDSLDSINHPALKTAIETTEECNKLEEPYKEPCYREIAESIGYYYDEIYCEKLKKKLIPVCCFGFGRLIAEEYPDLESINLKCNLKCSKSEDSRRCIAGASRTIGQESAKHIETEQCKKIEEELAKRLCYEGIGIQLANDDKESKLCEKTEDKKACLKGFAHATDKKGNRKEALRICQDLNNEKCYFSIGFHNPSIYNKSLKESFKDCEQYPYPENCKQGVADELAFKFFKKNQQESNKTLVATHFIAYKTINPLITKTGLIIKQQINPHFVNHFVNYKLFYLKIILTSLGIIVIICVLKNKKVQETIKRIYNLLVKKLNRNVKTIWTTYQKAKQKQPEPFKEQEAKITIPPIIFSNRTLSVLEHITKHLKENYDLNYSEIAKLLNKSPKTVWTTCQRARKKRG